MAQSETWYFIRDGVLYEHYENDGHTAMRKGLEAKDTPLCSVEEAVGRYPHLLLKVEDVFIGDLSYGLRK